MFKFKKYPVLKWSLLIIGFVIVSLFAFGYWFISLIPAAPDQIALSKTQAKDIPYLVENGTENNGKILAVVTSCDVMGTSDKKNWLRTHRIISGLLCI